MPTRTAGCDNEEDDDLDRSSNVAQARAGDGLDEDHRGNGDRVFQPVTCRELSKIFYKEISRGARYPICCTKGELRDYGKRVLSLA